MVQLSRFDGADYVHHRDAPRLQPQAERVFQAVKDGKWRTLGQISFSTGDPEPSVSAQLRHLRKPRFGAYNVERKYVGGGIYCYRITDFDISLTEIREAI